MKTTPFLPAALMMLAMSVSAEPARPLEATFGQDGSLSLRDGIRNILTIEPNHALKGWTGVPFTGESRKPGNGIAGRVRDLATGGTMEIHAVATQAGKGVRIVYEFAVSGTLEMESVHASLNLPMADWAGMPYAYGGKKGMIPPTFGEVRLESGPTRTISIGPAARLGGLVLTITRPENKPCLLQDSRRWGDNFEIRVNDDTSPAPFRWTAANPQRVEFTLAANRPIVLVKDEPVAIRAGADFVPLQGGLDVEPGSALDWSNLSAGPAGTKGWLKASAANPGTFEFEREPGMPVRFYGTNVGTGAQSPDHADAVRFADRLRARGYNSLRIHHHEMAPWAKDSGWLDPNAPDTLTFHPDRMEKFDYFFAELKKRGIYVTTDLYVSRPVKASEIVANATGDYAYKFKHMVCVSERAYENWKEYSRRLLNHVNPHTGLAYKDDPALTTLVLINEGNLGNDLADLLAVPWEGILWNAEFEKWKKQKNQTGEWGGPECRRFLWDIHRRTQKRMIDFLRNEIRSRQLITDMNGWTDEWGAQVCRAEFDFVDNHMYWDHPHFLGGAWQLPSRGGNGGGSAISAGGAGLHVAASRLIDKPFTITEFHFVPPNPFRAESGLLYGAFAAIQDWSGLYRFAYSGNPKNTFSPEPVGFFDIVNDPITQIAEYAAVALFIRGDLPAADHALVVAAPEAEFLARGHERVGIKAEKLGWLFKLGSKVGAGQVPGAIAMAPGAGSAEEALAAAKTNGWLPAANRTDLANGVYQDTTGGVTLETGPGVLTIDTPKTAGFAGPADTTGTAGPLTIGLKGSWAAAWASTVDGKPIKDSARILFAHITDVKNTGDKFAGRDQRVLESWGTLPYLVKAGKAAVSLKHPKAKSLKVWRLDLTGKRTARMQSRVVKGALTFTANTATTPDGTLLYEIAER